jgi:hypothetical protein
MIRPANFGFNSETALSNHFQHKTTEKDVNAIVRKEFDEVLTVFSNHKIAFHVFDDQQEILPDALFSNNWLAMLPTGEVTLFPMYHQNRRGEVRMDIVEWLFSKNQSLKLIDLSQQVLNNQFLEGTGSIVFDHFLKIAYACESMRTNLPLFEAYCQQINYRPISFESVDLYGNPIYHTNVMMSIGEKQVLVNLESIENPIERAMLKRSLQQGGRELIELSYAQMNSFCGNVLEVLNQDNEPCLIMSSRAFEAFTEDQLNQLQQFVHIVKVDVSTIEQVGGGGIRCMLTGLFF